MKVSISNIRGCEQAEFTTEKFTIIGGENRQGKSSIAQAIGATLTGECLFGYDGLVINIRRKIVQNGKKEGMVAVYNGEDSFAEIKYPQAKLRIKGENPPCASKIAVGFQKVMDIKDSERRKFFTEFLKAKPTKVMLLRELAGTEEDHESIKPDEFESIWLSIENYGWDISYKQVKENGVRLKGQWEHITKSKYGKVKAEDWVPENWSPDLINENAVNLTASVEALEKNLEVAIRQEAISEDEIVKLKTQAETYDVKFNEYNRLSDLDKAIIMQTDDLTSALLRAKNYPEPQKCPYCRKDLFYIDGKIVKRFTREKPTKGSIESLERQIEGLIQKRKRIREERDVVSVGLNISKKAVDQLKNIKPVETKIDVPNAREKLELAKRKLSAFNNKREAYQTHQSIQKNEIIASILSPNGLRLKVLASSLMSINSLLNTITKVAGWDGTFFDNNMDILYGGIPYQFCSDSEKFRINTILQLIIAKADNSQLCVIDGADILDRDGRNGLFKAILKVGVPAIVCMTLSKVRDEESGELMIPVSELPNKDVMQEIGGNSFWIEDGLLTEV